MHVPRACWKEGSGAVISLVLSERARPTSGEEASLLMLSAEPPLLLVGRGDASS